MADASPTTRATSLAWCPYDMDEWEARCEGLTAEEERALHRAFRKAWRDKEAPGTLVDRPDAWERLLGAKWRPLSAFLRTHFAPDPEHPGRVVWPRLLELHGKQTGRYQTAAEKAKKAWERPHAKPGPKPKPKPRDSRTDSPANSPGDSTANSPANSGANTDLRRGFTPAPNGAGGETPRRDDAASAAPDGAAASPPRTGANGHSPDAPNERRPEARGGPGQPPASLTALLRAQFPELAPPPALPEDPPPLLELTPEQLAERAARKRMADLLHGAGDAPVTVPPDEPDPHAPEVPGADAD